MPDACPPVLRQVKQPEMPGPEVAPALPSLVRDYFTATDGDPVEAKRRYRAMAAAAYAGSGRLADLVVAYGGTLYLQALTGHRVAEDAEELSRLAGACVAAAGVNGGAP